MSHRTELVDPHNHIIAVYQDKETKLDDAFKFLKSGLDRNEIVMIITDDVSKDKIRKRMKNEWNVNVDALEPRDYIIIKTTQEWYFPYGKPSAERINPRWVALTEISRIRGKSGVRAFGDTPAFFKHGFVKELVDYESTLDRNFDIPFTAVCAYDSKDYGSLSSEQLKTLHEHHSTVWK